MATWNIEEISGYKPKTTFWEDFSVADKFGINGILDTYNRAFAEWKDDYVYLTELVLVLNHKIWEHFNHDNRELSVLYDKLWREADAYAVDNLNGENFLTFIKLRIKE